MLGNPGDDVCGRSVVGNAGSLVCGAVPERSIEPGAGAVVPPIAPGLRAIGGAAVAPLENPGSLGTSTRDAAAVFIAGPRDDSAGTLSRPESLGAPACVSLTASWAVVANAGLSVGRDGKGGLAEESEGAEATRAASFGLEFTGAPGETPVPASSLPLAGGASAPAKCMAAPPKGSDDIARPPSCGKGGRPVSLSIALSRNGRLLASRWRTVSRSLASITSPHPSPSPRSLQRSLRIRLELLLSRLVFIAGQRVEQRKWNIPSAICRRDALRHHRSHAPLDARRIQIEAYKGAVVKMLGDKPAADCRECGDEVGGGPPIIFF